MESEVAMLSEVERKLVLLEGSLMVVIVAAFVLGVEIAWKATLVHIVAAWVLATLVGLAGGILTKDLRPAAICPFLGFGSLAFLLGTTIGLLL